MNFIHRIGRRKSNCCIRGDKKVSSDFCYKAHINSLLSWKKSGQKAVGLMPVNGQATWTIRATQAPLIQDCGDVRESIIPWSVSSKYRARRVKFAEGSELFWQGEFYFLKEFYCYVVHPCSDESPISGKPGDGDAQPRAGQPALTNQQRLLKALNLIKKLYLDRWCATTLVLAHHHVKGDPFMSQYHPFQPGHYSMCHTYFDVELSRPRCST